MIDIARFSKRLSEARAKVASEIRRVRATDTAGRGVWPEMEALWQELVSAEEALRQQQDELLVARDAIETERQRYLSLLEFAPDGYLVTDSAGVVREANHAALTMLGTTRAGLVGKPLAVFIPSSHRREFRAVVAHLGATGRVREWRLELQPRQGPAFPVSVALAPTAVGEAEVRWLLRDVSNQQRLEDDLRTAYGEAEQRVMLRTAELEGALRTAEESAARERGLREQAEEADRAKDAFLAMLSHELRTPMTALVGWVHLLLRGRLDAEASQRALESVERSTHAQVKLVNDILDVSRIITGKLQVEMSRVDFVPLAVAAVSVIQPSAQEKGLILECEHPAARVWVMGDAERLQQVLWNLLANAIKFTPPGGRLRVHVTAEGPRVSVTVEDTGIGIAPDFLPHIFDRFRQADLSSTRTHGGLGLGLAITRYLVEQHGGAIDARSEGLGKGATFRFWLPVIEDAAQSRAAADASARPGSRDAIIRA
jgi:PAS domain S-box-containing protein